MKKITLLLSLLLFSLLTLFSQNNILVIDYNNAFSSDQQNNNSIIYNRLLATQASVVRVNAIPATINPATYNQVWIFGDMGAPTAANQNPIINYINVGGAVYIQSEVSCCNNQAAYVDALINATVTVGGSINHTTTLGGYSQTGPSSTACNPPTWVTHSAAVRPFQGTPAANVLLAANATCGAAVPAGTVIGVKFRSCDMISGQGALISIGDFNVFPTAGTCTNVGILGTANDNLVIDYIANLFPNLVTCSNPSGPTMTTPANITVCNGANVPASAFTSTPAGATFAWTNSNTAIGLAASGSGNTPAFTATNTTTAPITATITVTPTLNGCPGTPVNYTITVNPSPVVNPIANITVCNGANVPASAFTSTPTGATFAWTNSNTTIGLAASGSGNTPAFTATNTTTATITVTPTLNGCVGTPVSYTITVNPSPVVNPIANITVCNGASVPASAFASTPAGASFTWTNSNSTIGLAASGSGNTPAFTATNTSGSVVTSTVSVTPTLNGCVGTPVNYTITVNPSPVVNPIANITVCNGANVPASAFASTPAGASFTWTNSNSTIGLAASGTGNTPAFTATNTTTAPITATITVTPTLNGCSGPPITYTITVNPTPVVNPIANITVCNGVNVPASAFASTPAGASFTWTNSNSTIGLAASGSGNTPAFTATNTSGSVVTSTVSVTPTLNGCVGTLVNYTITVNPTPAAPTAAGVTICPNNTATLTATAPGGTYEWFDAAVGGNLLATAASYTTPVLTATTSYYVQTTVNGCVSPRATVTVTVAPGLVVDAGLDTTICYGDAVTLGATPNGAGYSYSWDESGNLGFSTVFNPTVTPTATTTYVVTVTDPNNCFGSDSVTVTVNPLLSVTMNATNITCNGACDGVASVVVNGGTAPYSYSWSSGGTTDTETGLCPNLYTVTVTDALGCIVTGDTTITEPAALVLTLNGSSNPLCNGACDGSVSVTAVGGSGNYQFTIDGINFQTSGSFNNLCAGNYVVGVVDDNACVDTVMFTITDPDLLVIDSIVATDVSCNNANSGNNTNGSITIFASGGSAPLSYSIDNGTTFATTSVFSGLSPGSYTIVVVDVNGCSVNGGNIVINEPAAISIPNVVTDVSCNGYNDGQIAVAPQGGTPAYSYSWSVNGVGNNPVANNLVAGNVTVTVSDANGCSEAVTLTVNQPAPINFISFTADIFSGCAPLTVEFYNTTDTALIDSFYWDLGNGTIAFNDTSSTIYTNPGSYNVSLFVTDNNGCPGVLTQTAYIEVFENPTANFSYAPLDVTLFDPLVYFTDLSLFNIASWQWNFANLGTSALQHPNFTFPSEDTASYPVTLLVTNDDGCTDSITKLVKINGETGVFVPNAFTPDGDNLNEFFAPKGFGVSPNGYSFLIFDRWGELIFESYIPFDGWNGTYKDKLIENGVYSWRLEYKDTNGKRYEQMGKVSIIR
ncbi:MAG: gliding motility-associated C-terminal domain-containing protein [Flavobacteriales bacterium]|nr:gliding motility-associated C-terminal domain-containing protein [Flavobacteriales bacterium]